MIETLKKIIKSEIKKEVKKDRYRKVIVVDSTKITEKTVGKLSY